MSVGNPIHGERVVDGDASTLIALTLFKAGQVGTDTYTLQSDEFLTITDVVISDEENADVQLVADSAAAGRYIVSTKISAGGSFTHSFNEPYVCPIGVVPKFAGGSGAAARSSCVIQGFITK